MMNLDKRVDRLLEKARGRNRAGRGKGRTRLLAGLGTDAVFDALDAALDAADEDILNSVVGFAEEAARTPLRHPTTGGPWYDDGGNQLFDTHFFVSWLRGLREGSWALPEPTPRAVLEGFNARHGCVLWRCEDCLTAL